MLSTLLHLLPSSSSLLLPPPTILPFQSTPPSPYPLLHILLPSTFLLPPLPSVDLPSSLPGLASRTLSAVWIAPEFRICCANYFASPFRLSPPPPCPVLHIIGECGSRKSSAKAISAKSTSERILQFDLLVERHRCGLQFYRVCVLFDWCSLIGGSQLARQADLDVKC